MGMHRHRDPLRAMSDINVTNLLDTAFILIIALMIIAPAMTNGLKLALPESATAPPLNTPDKDKSLLVSIEAKQPGDQSEHILVDSKRITLEDLLTRVQSAKAANPELTVQVEADKTCTYGAIFSVLDTIKQGGVDNVDLRSEPITTEDNKKDEQK